MTAVVLVTATIGMGAYLYGPFREGVRQPLFAEARSMGWLFERKEHMAFGAGVCTWAAALAHLGSCRARGPLRTSLRSWARWGYAVASVFAIAAAACATVVASVRSL